MNYRQIIGYSLALVTTLTTCLHSSASVASESGSYPSKAIRLVVPYPPGGSADVLGRIVSNELSAALGQPVVVENRPGAGTAVGSKMVSGSPPDGYTLLLGTVSSHAMNPAISHVGYDPISDFTPIARLVSVPFVVLVNAAVPANTVQELIALARSKPGQITYSSAGSGTSNHLAGVLLNELAHIDLLHVPYKGSAPAMNDLLAGHVNMMFDLQMTAMPQMDTGRVRALAITSTERSALLPDVPTLHEAGIANYEASAWFGIFGPAGLPDHIVSSLNAELNEILNKSEVMAQLSKLGTEAAPTSPAVFAEYVQDEWEKWKGVTQAAKLALN